MVLEYRDIRIDTVAFDENTTKILAIPRVNAIRWIDLAFFVESVEGNTADPTEIQDTILNIIKKIRLVVDGDENKINIDGRKAFFLEKIENLHLISRRDPVFQLFTPILDPESQVVVYRHCRRCLCLVHNRLSSIELAHEIRLNSHISGC